MDLPRQFARHHGQWQRPASLSTLLQLKGFIVVSNSKRPSSPHGQLRLVNCIVGYDTVSGSL